MPGVLAFLNNMCLNHILEIQQSYTELENKIEASVTWRYIWVTNKHYIDYNVYFIQCLCNFNVIFLLCSMAVHYPCFLSSVGIFWSTCDLPPYLIHV